MRLMKEIAVTAPQDTPYRVFLVGGGTAVFEGWRRSSIDADVSADDDLVFHDIQAIKERLNINVEFAQPEQFVPALRGTDDRHRFIETIHRVSFFHYDPYAQVFSKIVRGFERDLSDAKQFIKCGWVEPEKLAELVREISESAYSRYPALSPTSVLDVVEDFVDAQRR